MEITLAPKSCGVIGTFPRLALDPDCSLCDRICTRASCFMIYDHALREPGMTRKRERERATTESVSSDLRIEGCMYRVHEDGVRSTGYNYMFW
jgi:hypothetical protein